MLPFRFLRISSTCPLVALETWLDESSQLRALGMRKCWPSAFRGLLRVLNPLTAIWADLTVAEENRQETGAWMT